MKLNVNMVERNDQTRQCEKLLAAVVAHAVRDLAIKPLKEVRFDKRHKGAASQAMIMNGISPDAFSAARFIFGKDGGLEAYLHWLDMNPKEFRKNLLELMWDDSPNVVAGWKPMQRRAMKANYLRWMDLQWLDQPEGDDDE